MRFGSVCSGIEAASVAWTPLGWQAAWLSEIEKFPCEVLKHHYPDVPNLGDMTKLPDMILSGQVEAPDLFCGGTPCQAFSVAGLRQSLDDARGNLSLTFCEIANAIDQVRSVQQSDPCIVFWENVPGVLNTKDNAFGCFLGALAGEDDALIAPGGRWTNAGFIDGPQRAVAWRVLDAQYFGVAQRRRRVFVVASARDDFDPAAVLFEFDGVRRDTAPSREAGERVAPRVTNGPPFSRTGNERVEAQAMVVGTLQARDYKGISTDDVTKCIIQPQAIAFEPGKLKRLGYGDAEPGLSPTLRAEAGDNQVAVASFKYTMGAKAHGIGYAEEQSPTLDTKADSNAVLTSNMAVRRLTPTECERLQGFPDGYTNIKDKCPDGPRYKALGNSWAVPVVRWIGERINRALA
jgi:DNA (cytosine-5)-methyltransferase 1